MQTQDSNLSLCFLAEPQTNTPLLLGDKKDEIETLKPWITKGLKQSIKVRDRLYKDMTKTKSIQLHQIKEQSFKMYPNKIVNLTKISRKSHYQKFFEENKRNSKAIQQGIHSIIYSKKGNRINTPSSLLIEGNTITDPQDISEHFSNFFISIGQDLQKPKEISHLIKTLKNSKSLGPNSIPAYILKEIHEKISISSSTLVNKSFTTGVFPNMCKSCTNPQK